MRERERERDAICDASTVVDWACAITILVKEAASLGKQVTA